jgi:ribosomal protein L16/L10AE
VLLARAFTVTLTKEEKAWAEEDSIEPAPTHANELVKACGRFWVVTVADKTVTGQSAD